MSKDYALVRYCADDKQKVIKSSLILSLSLKIKKNYKLKNGQNIILVMLGEQEQLKKYIKRIF